MPAEREVSLPFAPPSPDAGPRLAERGADAALRRRAASLIERHAEDIADRWESQLRSRLPNATDSHTGSSRVAGGVEIVRSLASALAADGAEPRAEPALAREVGAAAFGEGLTVAELLGAFNLLESMCLALFEDGETDATVASASAADGVRLCRHLHEEFASVVLAAVRGHAQAADVALQERFRRLRHDLRNPLSTIRSALELMADESIPEDARRSPRFRTMIERNSVALDQMVVNRLSDAEAHVMPATKARDRAPAPGSLGRGEPRDDVGGARQGEDRQSGTL